MKNKQDVYINVSVCVMSIVHVRCLQSYVTENDFL